MVLNRMGNLVGLLVLNKVVSQQDCLETEVAMYQNIQAEDSMAMAHNQVSIGVC